MTSGVRDNEQTNVINRFSFSPSVNAMPSGIFVSLCNLYGRKRF